MSPELHELADGRRVELRPIRPEDAPALSAAFDRLGAESRYRRFLVPQASLSERELRYLTDVDHRTHEAIVAVDPETGDGVGVARYVADPHAPDTAEMAVTVVDAWQGRGLGAALVQALVDRARANGIRRFAASVLATNTSMLALLDDAGEVQLLRRDGAVSEYAIELPRAGLGAMRDLLRAACRPE
jgi:RimJ/RimL family protein N-acetyltransferase